jgi:putative ABC transport system substrate-binding protein
VKRRDLIVAALATVCAPATAWAQASGRIRRIGWLDLSSSAENLGTFVQALGARGWVEGKTFRVDYRGGEGKTERLAAVAAELVRLPADVIVAPGTPEALAAKKAANAVPIVMTGVDDPVGRGLVGTLARPGGNITGLASARAELGAKLLSLLRDLSPRATSVAVIVDANDPDHRTILTQLQTAARSLGFSVNAQQVQRHTEVEPAFAAIKKQGNQLLVVPMSNMLIPRWTADLALKHGLALASTAPAYVYEGGLMTYTDDWQALFDRAAIFVDRILKGARPADLPVELPTKFKLIVNVKTARALGLTMPPAIMLQADHVVE